MNWLRIGGEWTTVLVQTAISAGAVLVELATPTTLISTWFAAGGVAGALAASINLPLWMQTVCSVAVSLASMLIVRPIASRYLRGNTVPTNVDHFIGEIAQVTSLVTEDEQGEVKVNGTMWHAIPANDDSIEEGAKVKAVAIEGTKLPVKRVSERQEKKEGSDNECISDHTACCSCTGSGRAVCLPHPYRVANKGVCR